MTCTMTAKVAGRRSRERRKKRWGRLKATRPEVIITIIIIIIIIIPPFISEEYGLWLRVISYYFFSNIIAIRPTSTSVAGIRRVASTDAGRTRSLQWRIQTLGLGGHIMWRIQKFGYGGNLICFPIAHVYLLVPSCGGSRNLAMGGNLIIMFPNSSRLSPRWWEEPQSIAELDGGHGRNSPPLDPPLRGGSRTSFSITCFIYYTSST